MMDGIEFNDDAKMFENKLENKQTKLRWIKKMSMLTPMKHH